MACVVAGVSGGQVAVWTRQAAERGLPRSRVWNEARIARTGVTVSKTVERLAEGTPFTDRQRTIQQAAQDCLPLLRAHVGGVDTTQTLLRASMPETNTPDTLLRATGETHAADADLLRAANAHETSSSN